MANEKTQYPSSNRAPTVREGARQVAPTVREGAPAKLPKTLLFLVALTLLFSSPTLANSPDRILVLANQNSPESMAIAQYYLQKRQIPESHLCLLDTTTAETIDRTSFELEILRPTAAFLAKNLLQDQILYIVTTQGLPLIVDGDAGPVGDLASVDSELALLYRYLVFGEYTYFGRIKNPYFSYTTATESVRHFNRKDFDIYLVTRLMGGEVKDVKALIDRSSTHTTERGTYYLDLKSHRTSHASDWLQQTSELLQEKGIKISQGLSASGRLSGYAGWSSEGSTNSTLPQWSNGALALLFHGSLNSRQNRSAAEKPTFREKAFQFITSGVTGMGGFVADPTVDGFFRPNILFPSYLSGYNLAESYYRSLRYLSWRQVVIGDPLLSPFDQQNRTAANPDLTIDTYTGLPSHYSRRRTLYLTAKYSSAETAVRNLLRAERLADQQQWAGAIDSIDSCLREDVSIPAAHLLKAELLEREEEMEESFYHYQKATELGKASKSLYYKLVELGLSRPALLEDAENYARWLYVRFGSREPQAVKQWAEIQRKLGRLKESAATYHKLADVEGPSQTDSQAILGEIYFELENWEAAQVYLSKAMAFERVKSETLNVKGPEPRPQTPDPSPGEHSEPRASGRLASLLASVNQKLEAKQALQEKARVDRGPEIIPARVVHREPVPYPIGAKKNRVEGEVILKLLIDEEGNLLKSEAMMGPKQLAEAVLDAVEEWEFEPRRVRGRPEPGLLTVKINFKLER